MTMWRSVSLQEGTAGACLRFFGAAGAGRLLDTFRSAVRLGTPGGSRRSCRPAEDSILFRSTSRCFRSASFSSSTSSFDSSEDHQESTLSSSDDSSPSSALLIDGERERVSVAVLGERRDFGRG